MIARDGALCLYEDARATSSISPRASRSRRSRRRRRAGAKLTAELTPHHLVLTDEEVRSLDSRFKMNPPLRTEDDRQALIEALRRRHRRLHRHRPRPARDRREGRSLRGRDDGRHGPRDRLRGPLHRARPARDPRPRPGRREDGRRRPRSSTSSSRRSLPTPPRTSYWSISNTSGRAGPRAGRAAPTTPASTGAGSDRGP